MSNVLNQVKQVVYNYNAQGIDTVIVDFGAYGNNLNSRMTVVLERTDGDLASMSLKQVIDLAESKAVTGLNSAYSESVEINSIGKLIEEE